MADLLRQIINMSLTAGAVILVVLLARVLLRRAPRWCSYALWSVVLFRLLCPVSISSALSMLNLARTPVSTGSGRITMVDYAGVIHQSAQTAQQAVDLPVATGAGAVQNAPAGPGWQEVLAWVWRAPRRPCCSGRWCRISACASGSGTRSTSRAACTSRSA